jgi:hypothetical protein
MNQNLFVLQNFDHRFLTGFKMVNPDPFLAMATFKSNPLFFCTELGMFPIARLCLVLFLHKANQ